MKPQGILRCIGGRKENDMGENDSESSFQLPNLDSMKEILCPLTGFKQQCKNCRCIVWRWYDGRTYGDKEGQTQPVKVFRRRGYCGLAGKPNDYDFENRFNRGDK